ncbi:MAG: HPr(Ser) kinase/phosphatase [Lachnospiraceae bacterium]|nr:HPr(Ser) kinase/phosphatase [Lachnospiraceae bacterium]
MAEYTVDLTKIIETMKLENCTPNINVGEIKVSKTDINRPALQLTGYYDFFDSNRMQVIGQVEYTYMEKIGKEKSKEMMKRIMEYKVPCIIFCRSLEVPEEIIEIANEQKVPILRTEKTTSAFVAEVIRWLNVELAQRMTVHGVLVDVYGEGLLIMGESGIGKSEAALELIKRGHRLVSDDVVEIRRVSDITLIGTAPDITRHFIELRGIGIIDVKNLFGVESVKNTQSIDLVIKLEEWNKEREYDRLGLEEEYTEFLGNKVVCHSIPIRPGRNLAVICEAAAVNYRQKKMGYNAAQEIYNRVTNNIMNK